MVASTNAAYFSPIKDSDQSIQEIIQSDDATNDDDDSHRYGSGVNRTVPFFMSDTNIDVFIAKDCPFVLILSKTSYQVKKHVFSQSVFMKGRSSGTF